ncbi:hypothetical protein Bbelb_106820 [Branchiostoma belcheri]|nr:hypothetical protein Bbelb_106820 [Branchiostoma belcheri]
MSTIEKKLPPDGGNTKGAAVDISRLSSGRLHPVPDECLGYEEESVYDYGIPEDVRGYKQEENVYRTAEDVHEEDEPVYRTAEDVHEGYGSAHDKPESEGAHGNKPPGEEESFAYKAKARVIGLWTRMTSSRVIVPAVGCGIVVIASVVAAIILATHLDLVRTEDTLGSMMQEDMMIRANLQKVSSPFLTTFFDDNHTAALEWLEPFANISLDSKTLPVIVTSLPTKDLNECDGNPCEHGRCVNKNGGYKCTCNPGWTGQNCQQDLNECTRNPCQHGRCVNKDGGYKCTCNPGWTGQNCQQDLNECDGNPCQHGRCVNKDGGYKCTCNPGWTGQNCQQDLNECDGNPCEHGRCVNKDGGYNCTCNPGWTGQNCLQDLNECTKKPCQHGRCVNKDGGYICTCNPGWTGQKCQQDLNECTWKPCTHGHCVNKDGGYKCTCNPGWTGQNCQQDLNECDGNPCQHGRCVNKDGGYKCTCNPGWTGQNCQQDLNECDGNPCEHGRCVNKDGGYKCTCNPGWTGQNCQQDLNGQEAPSSTGAWLRRDSSWVMGSTGPPHVANGVTYDAAKALDGNTGTLWNPQGLGLNYNNWSIVLDIAATQTLTRIAVNNYGDTTHDIAAFTLQSSQVGSPYSWEVVVSVENVQAGTDQRQEFGGFQGTARYWRFVVTRTHGGWQPWLTELNLYYSISPAWRKDLRCGAGYPAANGQPAVCDPLSLFPCCSPLQWCGISTAHCDCVDCVNYRKTDLNECTGNPCKHGRCVNKDGGYKCTCNPGWTGQNCQQDLNECTRNPCQHGRCVNKDGGYKCTCNRGWTGQDCQQDVNECTRNPCQHGRCVNKDGGYNCACDRGWTGHSCHLAKPCRVGWSGYKNHCYKLMKGKAEWEEAKKQCERLGANLASITSRGEANFINTIITDAPVGKWGIHLVWFGLHRNDKFRKFTDGSPVSYTNWEPGQPNNNGNFLTDYKGQDCVGMYSKSCKGCGGHLFLFTYVEKGQWNDDQCYRSFPFICKRPK